MSMLATIIAMQAVASARGADLSKLKPHTEFIWEGGRYQFGGDGRRCRWVENMGWRLCDDEKSFVKMISTADEIYIIPPYTAAEAEQAKKDMGCSAGFRWASKDIHEIVMLWTDEPYDVHENREFAGGGHSIWSRYDYPSLKPGKKVRLEVIAGCENESL